ncbi:MAG: NAD-dependent epimerase/dehydratase family protein [Chitinophagaceae bacterium]|nr:MAG: NAD-dependent epimerase/dehydratase family protein [Chitinophagaceae bacterium]
MVTGNGMIAKRFSRFAADADRLIFASGVSNSSTTDEAAFKKESDLLLSEMSKYPAATVVYFSTCSIYDPSLQQSAYVLHKLKMEDVIKTVASSFIIFRVSNPVGFTGNTHTLLNYFVERLLTNTPITIWQYASRNLIDLDDMFHICEAVLKDRHWLNKTINVANPVNYPVISILEAMEHHFKVQGNYTLVEKGNSPMIDTTDIQPLYSSLHIDFTHHYLEGLLNKYYPQA